MKKVILLMTACFSILLSCTKEDSEPSKKDLLCGKYWKMSALTMKSGAITINYFDILNDCQKDDLIKYNPDGTYVTDNKQRCDLSGPVSETGTWLFNSDETIITQDGDILNIDLLTKSNLKVTYAEIIDDMLVTMTATYVPN